MLPRLQGENCISVVLAMGFMMNCEFASQLLAESGQHCVEFDSHPSVHCVLRSLSLCLSQKICIARLTSC